MPVTKSAKKALRRDKRRTVYNQKLTGAMRRAVKLVTLKPSPAHLAKAYSLIDRAAKRNILHRNKAARLKARLARRKGTPSPKR